MKILHTLLMVVTTISIVLTIVLLNNTTIQPIALNNGERVGREIQRKGEFVWDIIYKYHPLGIYGLMQTDFYEKEFGKIHCRQGYNFRRGSCFLYGNQ